MEVVYITTPSFTEAEKIASNLVASKLIACANLFDNVHSIYSWQGQIKKEREVVIIAKTIKSKIKDIIAKVNEMHKYDCPCIFSISTSNVNNPFLEWLKHSTS